MIYSQRSILELRKFYNTPLLINTFLPVVTQGITGPNRIRQMRRVPRPPQSLEMFPSL